MLEGRYDEGVREAEIAVELDPLSHYARCNLMTWYYAVRRFADSRAEAGRILEMDSTWQPAHDMLYRIAFQEGKLEEAIGHARKALAIGSKGKVMVPDRLSWSEYKVWDLRVSEEMARVDESSIGGAAIDYAMFGEKEKALYWLEKAADKANWVLLILFYPDFDCLRDDPRFEKIVSQVHLPVPAYCTINQRRTSQYEAKE
jgi:tetratricopeptide (TPR) repeat protein